jgi:hypothetical protein
MPLLDHHALGRLEHHALAGADHVVVGVTAPRDPHPAAAHDEFTADMVDANRLAPARFQGPGTAGIKLRFHHQSPVTADRLSSRLATMIVGIRARIQ